MNVEQRLAELVGPAAGRLHTARSPQRPGRNRFPALGRDACGENDRTVERAAARAGDRAEDHAETVMPGFTHLQAAQPVTFGHHLMAYVEMLARDRSRLGVPGA